MAYFHWIEEIDELKVHQIISPLLRHHKHSIQCIMPNDAGFAELCVRYNVVKDSVLYWYQNPDVFYLKVLSDLLVPLHIIQAKLQSYQLRDAVLLFHLSDVIGKDITIELSLNFKRFTQFADGYTLRLFMQMIERKYPNHAYIKYQFRELLVFQLAYKQLNAEKVLECDARDRWRENFEKYLKDQVFKKYFDVDLWLSLVQSLLTLYNKNSEERLYKLIISLQEMRVPILNATEIKIDVMQITNNIRFNFINMHSTDNTKELLQSALAIRRLATDKLNLFNSVHIFNYLYVWMIDQRMKRDIHVFVEEKCRNSCWFQKYVVNPLEKCGLMTDYQLVHLRYRFYWQCV